MTILVLTADPLPLPGLPATGAGLRAWSLAEGLSALGVAARAIMPASILTGRADLTAEPFASHVYPDASLQDYLDQARPQAIILQHWGMMSRLRATDLPLAIDLAGPHLLERRHWGHENLAADQAEKLAALRRADFVVCSGKVQRLYFLPWLTMAGFDPADPQLCPAIPFSWDPEGPPARQTAPGDSPEITFVSGGVLLPWQNPLPLLQILLEEMDECGRGRLIFCGGAHPSMNVAGGETVALLEALEHHPRVELHPLTPLDEWIRLVSKCDVAFDLFPRNNERELAFPTRTSMYLWNGLPVLHADYDELAGLIQEYGAGWTVDPASSDALRAVLRRILGGEERLQKMAASARKLAEERLNWAETMKPLAEFCRDPKRRAGATATSGGESAEESTRILALQRDLAVAQMEVEAVQGKWPFRLARILKRMSWLIAPLVYPVALMILALVAVLARLADMSGKPRQPPESLQ